MPDPPKAEPSGLSLAIAGTLLERGLFPPKVESIFKADSEPSALEFPEFSKYRRNNDDSAKWFLTKGFRCDIFALKDAR